MADTQYTALAVAKAQQPRFSSSGTGNIIVKPEARDVSLVANCSYDS